MGKANAEIRISFRIERKSSKINLFKQENEPKNDSSMIQPIPSSSELRIGSDELIDQISKQEASECSGFNYQASSLNASDQHHLNKNFLNSVQYNEQIFSLNLSNKRNQLDELNQVSCLKVNDKDSSIPLETSDHILDLTLANQDLEKPIDGFELTYQIFGEILGLFIGMVFVSVYSIFQMIEIFLKFAFMLYKRFNSSQRKP